MIRALLVDLDDTLLENDLGRFLPAYFGLLSEALSAFGPREKILPAVLEGTRAMLGNQDPSRTLAESFYQSFSAATGAKSEPIRRAIAGFYAGAYAGLRELTSPKAGAPDLLREAKRLGWAVVVATNPLMTRHAIEQRLAWAGVGDQLPDLALVTDVERFHFAKPHPAYFAEVLGRLGLLPEEAVMVGNDLTEDLEPAASLGCAVFHVSGSPDPRTPGGSLEQACLWLATARGSNERSHDPQALMARLEGQLASLLGRLAEIPPQALRSGLSGDALTPLQAICHLRDVDREVHRPRLQQIVDRENPFFSAVDTDAWISERGYNRESLEQARAEMVGARRDVIDFLRGLQPSDWIRPARSALLGPINLAEWVAVLTEHDLRHQAEIRADAHEPVEGEAV